MLTSEGVLCSPWDSNPGPKVLGSLGGGGGNSPLPSSPCFTLVHRFAMFFKNISHEIIFFFFRPSSIHWTIFHLESWILNGERVWRIFERLSNFEMCLFHSAFNNTQVGLVSWSTRRSRGSQCYTIYTSLYNKWRQKIWKKFYNYFKYTY